MAENKCIYGIDCLETLTFLADVFEMCLLVHFHILNDLPLALIPIIAHQMLYSLFSIYIRQYCPSVHITQTHIST